MKRKFLNRDIIVNVLIVLLALAAFLMFWRLFVVKVGQLQWDPGSPP